MVSENVLICFDMCWYVLIKEGHVSCIPFRRDSNLKANLNNMFRTFCQSKPDKLDSEHKNIQMFKRFQALCNEGFLKALGERLSEFRSAIWYDKIWYIYIHTTTYSEKDGFRLGGTVMSYSEHHFCQVASPWTPSTAMILSCTLIWRSSLARSFLTRICTNKNCARISEWWWVVMCVVHFQKYSAWYELESCSGESLLLNPCDNSLLRYQHDHIIKYDTSWHY